MTNDESGPFYIQHVIRILKHQHFVFAVIDILKIPSHKLQILENVSPMNMNVTMVNVLKMTRNVTVSHIVLIIVTKTTAVLS
jgi:hypothetical protein